MTPAVTVPIETVGIANCYGDLPWTQTLRLAKPGSRQIGGVDAQNREVGVRIFPDHGNVGSAAVGKHNLHFIRTADYMAVGENQAVRADDEARTTPGHGARSIGSTSATTAFNLHHGRADHFSRAHHGLRIGVEQLVVRNGLGGTSAMAFNLRTASGYDIRDWLSLLSIELALLHRNQCGWGKHLRQFA